MPHNWQSASKAESSCGDGSNGCCDGIASGLPRKVAVAGADGRTGSEVIEALRRYGVEEVIGGVRQTSKAASVPALQLQGVKVAEIDLVQGCSPPFQTPKSLLGMSTQRFNTLLVALQDV